MHNRVMVEKHRFSKVPQADDFETSLSDDDGASQYVIRRKSWARLVRTVMPMVISVMASGIIGAWAGIEFSGTSQNQCARVTSQYSPILKEVGIVYESARFNGSLLKENVFRLKACPAVDAAWESLGVDYRSLSVSADEALKSGFLPDQVQVSQKYGGGFVANVEGLHQLHCLNLVRKSLYYNFDYYYKMGKGPFSNSDHILQLHVSHCVDIIRQQLMCTLDTGLLGQVWFNPGEPELFVDFNTRHTCKNFDAVREWAKERQLPEDVEFDFLQPPGKHDYIYESIP